MERRVLGLVLVLAAGGNATAEAALLQSTADRFQLDIAPEGAQVCVVFPRLPSLQCDDLAGVNAPSEPGLKDFMYVRRPSGSYTLSHIVAPPQAGGEAGRKALAGQIMRAMRASEATAAPGPEPRVEQRRFGAVDVTRVDLGVELDGGAGHEPWDLAITFYALLGAEAAHALVVVGSPAVIPTARRDVEAALPRVHFKSASPRAEASLLERAGPFLVLALLALVVVGTIVVLARRVDLKERLEKDESERGR
jgi:hypothetical protein